MADEIQKSFVKSFLEFLRKQIQEQSLPTDNLESIEVAVQCLEAAFELFPDENDTQDLPTNQPSSSTSATNAGGASDNLGNQQQPQQQQQTGANKYTGIGGIGVPSQLQQNYQTIDLFDLYQSMYVELNPKRKEFGENIKNDGNRLMKEGKFQEALLQYNRSITYDPTNPVFYCNRAAAYIRVGQHEKAVADCKMALAYNPEYSKAHGRMGIAYSNLNKFNEARTAYQRALELEPDNQDYVNNLRVAEERCSSNSGGMGGIGGGDGIGGNISLPINLANLGQVFAAAQNAQSGAGGGGGGGDGNTVGPNLANLLFENVPGNVNMRDLFSDMMRGPIITTALQSLASNPDGILDISRHVAAAIATDNPELIRNVHDTLTSAVNMFQQGGGGDGNGNNGDANNIGGQQPPGGDKGPSPPNQPQ